MKRLIRVTRLILWLSFSALAVPGFGSQAKTPEDSEQARDFKTFSQGVQAYVKMQKDLEASLPALKLAEDPAQIAEHQHALARKTIDARRDARQGDIFTHEVAERFRIIIRGEFKGPEGHLARRRMQQDTPFKVVPIYVERRPMLRLRLLCCPRLHQPVDPRPGADPAAEKGLDALRGHWRHGEWKQGAI